jgi:hypothetical protein
MVYRYITIPLGELQTQSSDLFSEKESVKLAEFELDFIKKAAAGVAKAEFDMDQEEDEGFDGGEVVPDIEKEAFSVYPEKGDLGNIGLETGIFGFGASGQYNGEEISLSVDTPFGGIGGSTENMYTKTSSTYVLHGAKAEGNTEWFTNAKVVNQALDSTGKTGAVLGKIGKIGIGFSNGVRTGEYIVMGADNKIKDRGLLYVRETGGDVGMFGRSEKVEVRKSYMTGFSKIQKATKYKFWFASYES